MNFPHASFIASTAVSDGPKLTDWLTAVGTVGLAFVTVVTLIVTVRIASAGRRHDDQIRIDDRAEANRLLLEEREAAEQRLRGERQDAEDARQRERQADSAMRLLERIAKILPLLSDLPYRGGLDAERKAECDESVRNLGSGMLTDLVIAGNEALAVQYGNVVKLVNAVWIAKWAKEPAGDDLEYLAAQLRRYAVFAQMSLQRFITHGEVLDTGKPYYPKLVRKPGVELWSPDPEPDGWYDAVSDDPRDPEYWAPG